MTEEQVNAVIAVEEQGKQAEAPIAIGVNNNILVSKEQFEHGQRVAKLFASSKLVPEVYRGNVADCFLALHRASTLGVEPLFYMEHAYVVHGKLSVDGKMCKTLLERSGRYQNGVDLVYCGEGDKRKCIARGIRQDGVTEEAEVSVAMAKAEGWWDKNPKWRNLTDQMLAYRACSFFINRYCPYLLGGAATIEEMIDVNGTQVIRNMRGGSSLNSELGIKPILVSNDTKKTSDELHSPPSE